MNRAAQRLFVRLLVLGFGLAKATLATAQTAVVEGERLSAWILRVAGPNADMTALHWRVDTERRAQTELRAAVLDGVAARPELAQWVSTLPVTGRLPLARHDPRWLQGALEADLVLGRGDSVIWLQRPSKVAVVDGLGVVCMVPHRSGAYARDYVRACAVDAAQAWVVQPDGRVSAVGVLAWNAQSQDQPAPGAWLLAPVARSGLGAAASDNLARFLATQLPPEEVLPASGAAMRTVVWDAAQPDLVRPRDAVVTASDWGEIGLLQTPSARMAETGSIRTTYNRVWPYTNINVMLQPLDWMETGFRYTDVANQLYGPVIAGDQSYKDKSIDVKFRLWEEGAWLPQIAVGARDIGGTGLFSTEYLVANKRWGDWDMSLGLGWGYLGKRGDVTAPLGFLGSRFNTRPATNFGFGGTVSSDGMFRGPASVFGGVQWNTPLTGLVLKAELDGNDYQNEPFGSVLQANSPLNWGAVYRYSPNVDLSAAWERGERLSLGFTLHTAVNKLEVPKALDPVLPRIAPAASLTMAPSELPPQAWQLLSQEIEKFTDWQVQSLDHARSTLTVTAEADQALYARERVERATRILHHLAPASIGRFVLVLQERGMAMSTVEVNRAEWVSQRTQAQAPSLTLAAEQIYPGNTSGAGDEGRLYQKQPEKGLNIRWAPSYSQILGGPDGFLLYELGVQAKLDQRFTPSTWLSGNFNMRLIDNYAGFKYDAPSALPRVRTFAREYVTTSRATLPLLQLTHVAELGRGHYGSVYGGLLEDMYGGVGGEWLYRPWRSPLALGVDVNHVRQRDFSQNFTFRNYQITTGHATAYWDTGWNDVQVKLSAGQYLAGDRGVTMDVSRVFPNGASIGAWATKTNVSAEQFGEGSFDKGVYIKIPFDAILPKSSSGDANVVWNPLTRDGGARLNRHVSLIDLTKQNGSRAWTASSTPVSDAFNLRKSGTQNAYVLQEEPVGVVRAMGASAVGLGGRITQVPGSTWLMGGGAVLAASLLDSTVNAWAQQRQGERWSQVGDAASSIPYVMAAGAGLAFLGAAGDDAADTARTSVVAASYALGMNLLTKYAVGRARPLDGLGQSQFNGFSDSASQSSLASNHMALAFALATPFAKQYDKPWLYALAATTGLGRIQNQEHWFSDVVAGSLMGYAIGSMASDEQTGHSRRVRLSATPQSVAAHWQF
jgi:membrane-associated phospholipid phosphatase